MSNYAEQDWSTLYELGEIMQKPEVGLSVQHNFRVWTPHGEKGAALVSRCHFIWALQQMGFDVQHRKPPEITRDE